MPASLVEHLNPRQRDAVEFGLDGNADSLGPLLVIAGAGSGKTKTLSHRVANLLQHGADPSRILLLTFSRRAAAEMIRRVDALEARRNNGTVPGIDWAGTFHAVGARLLRLYAPVIGLDPGFSILDRSDAEDLIDLLRGDLGLTKGAERFPRKATCLAIYSQAVNGQEPLDQVLANRFPWCGEWEGGLKALFRAYVESKQSQVVLDYDDLLLWWARMMEEEDIAQQVGARFDHVLVDEYQDTNALQASILLAMKPDGAGLTVVGDDAQAIYSFRAATVRNILDFPTMFGRPAQVVTLEQNYRSTQAILDACNAVIGLARQGHPKSLFSQRGAGCKPLLASVGDEAGQADYVIAAVLANLEAGLALKDQAVLFRASHHSAQLELALARHHIPYVKYGGLKFLEAAHVKDLLAILRFAENPRDQAAGLRVLKLIPGVGAASARKALAAVATTGALSALVSVNPPAAARQSWPAAVDMLTALAAAPRWEGQIGLARQWYDPLLESGYDDLPARRSDLEQLERLAAGYGTRQRFLTELTLDPPEATGAEAGAASLEEDYLILSTIHSAKGQEWRAVLVLSVVDGCIPSDLATGSTDDIEEERRLLYVAMTRARDQLTLIHPLRFHIRSQSRFGDGHVFAPRSRFLPPDTLRFFDLAAGGAPGRSAERTLQSLAPVDVGAKMRKMWG